VWAAVSRRALLFLAPAVVATLIGLWGFTTVPLSGDEAVTASAATRTASQLWQMLHHVDAVHGAYYLILHYWVSWFGASEGALRVPSLIGVAVAAGLLALLGRRLASWRAGLIAGLLFACAPLASMFAQNARPYGVVFALTVGLTLCLLVALDGRKIAFLGYGVILFALVAIHLFALLIMPAHAVMVGLVAGRSRNWRPAMWWFVTCVVFLAPLAYMVRLIVEQQGTAGWIIPPGWPVVLDTVVWLCGGTYLATAAAVLLAFAYGRGAGRTPSVFEVSVPWLVLPPALLLIASQFEPLYAYRYVAFSAPALALLAGTALDRLRWWLIVPVTAALIAATVPLQDAVRHRPTGVAGVNDLRADAAFLEKSAQPGDGVIYVAPGQRYLSSAYPEPYRRLIDVTVARTPAEARNLTGSDIPNSEMGPRLAGIERVWTVKYFIWPGGGPGYRQRESEVFAALKANGFRWAATTRFKGAAIALWERARPSAP
jgi:mannosyltransferase